MAGLNHGVHMVESVIEIRRNIAMIAEGYGGSKDWNYENSFDNFDENTNKCNKFVYDVTTEAGASPGTPNGFLGNSPPTAGQWADPKYSIKGWKIVSKPQRGDVVAYAHNYSDATGHVAIIGANVVGYRSNIQYSIGTSGTYKSIARTGFGFDATLKPSSSTYIYRRYVGR